MPSTMRNRLINCLSSLFFALLLCSAGSLSAKNLLLIISSTDKLVYISHKESWRSYMHQFPNDFESYFIEFEENLSTEYVLEGDTLKIRGSESYIPGILDKTIKALQFFAPRFAEFEYIVRPNLSSFLVLPRLNAFLRTQPKENFYCGHSCRFEGYDNNPFFTLQYVSGSCITLSTNAAKILIQDRGQMTNVPYHTYHADDLLIAKALLNHSIAPTHFPSIFLEKRINLIKKAHLIPNDVFHFRVKISCNDYRRYQEETKIHAALFQTFY